MARLQGAAKPPASVQYLKKVSSLAGASVADAVLATNVVPTPDSACKGGTAVASLPDTSPETPVSLLSSDLPSVDDEEVNTPAIVEEVGVGPLTAPDTVPIPSEAQTAASTSLSGEQPGVRNYASLLMESAKLEEIGTPSEHVSGVPFVLIPDENIAAAKEEFKDFIYARFHGEWPTMGRMIGVLNALRAKSGPRIFVHNIGEGEYLLRVNNEKTKEMLLSRTCWNVAGLPMFVAPWSPEFTPEEAPLTFAVIPVELRDVPYLLFNKESLSRIATAVGKPVSLAPETERKENFKVAKLYVRADLTKPLPRKIISGYSNGKETEIAVSYPWLPVKCELCRKYGHSQDRCRSQIGIPQPRKRSKSPIRDVVPSGKTRRNSRPGRVKRPPPAVSNQSQVVVSTRSLVVSATDQEEGQVTHQETGKSSSKARKEPLPDGTSRGVMPDGSEGSKLQDSGIAGENQHSQYDAGGPFYLVTGRKSGRRAKSSH